MAEIVQSKVQPIEFEDAEQVIHAIHHGDVDAFVVMKGTDPQVVTLAGADEPYRVLVQRMNEGVLTVDPDGRITHASLMAEDLAEQSPVGLAFSQAFRLEANEVAERLLKRFSAKALDQALATKPFHGVEVKFRGERLSKRVFLLSAGPLL